MVPGVRRKGSGPTRSSLRVVPREFYARHASIVARDLIGKVLVRRIGRQTLSGRIVETEAYTSDDPASHAFRGRTTRNQALFGEVGRAYIYQTHGMNFCLNAVARSRQPAGGVLIRALEPLEGVDLMKRFRGLKDVRRLAKGPGNLGRAMRIDKRLYGADLTEPGPLFITESDAARPSVVRTTRVGVTSARERARRFLLEGSPFVSKSPRSRRPGRV
jgi:DNA-3-methyladenine glycosylase